MQDYLFNGLSFIVTWRTQALPQKQKASVVIFLADCFLFLFFGMYPSPIQSFDIDLVVSWGRDISCPPASGLSDEKFVARGEWLTQVLPPFDVDADCGKSRSLYPCNLSKTFSSDLAVLSQ